MMGHAVRESPLAGFLSGRSGERVHGVVPADISFEDFLAKIEAMERIVTVEGLSFSHSEDTATPSTFNMKVSAFYMPELKDLIDHLPQVDAPNPANKKHPFN